MKTYKVCISCVGSVLICDVIHALRSADDFAVEIMGIDANEKARGRVLCDSFYQVAAPVANGEVYLADLLALHDKAPFDALIVFSEEESVAVATHQVALREKGIAVAVSEAQAVADMTDKLALNQKLEGAGVDNGGFAEVSARREVQEAIKALGYPKRPVVIKPRFSRGARGIFIFDSDYSAYQLAGTGRLSGRGDFNAVMSFWDEKEIVVNDMVAVPHYSGDTYDVDSLAKDGKLLHCCARLRQWQNPLSPSSTGHKVTKACHPKILRLVKVLCEVFAINGVGDFDIVFEGDTPRVIDASVRLSGSVGAALLAGANFPAQLLRLVLDLPLKSCEVSHEVIARPFMRMVSVPPVNEHDYL